MINVSTSLTISKDRELIPDEIKTAMGGIDVVALEPLGKLTITWGFIKSSGQ